jgi:hypothetical protein
LHTTLISVPSQAHPGEEARHVAPGVGKHWPFAAHPSAEGKPQSWPVGHPDAGVHPAPLLPELPLVPLLPPEPLELAAPLDPLELAAPLDPPAPLELVPPDVEPPAPPEEPLVVPPPEPLPLAPPDDAPPPEPSSPPSLPPVLVNEPLHA